MNRENLKLVGEAALFGVSVVGLGAMICLFLDASLKWSPVFGALAFAGLVRVGKHF